jgi:hypothetical protein
MRYFACFYILIKDGKYKIGILYSWLKKEVDYSRIEAMRVIGECECVHESNIQIHEVVKITKSEFQRLTKK